MAASAGARTKQDSSTDNEPSDGLPVFGDLDSDFEYGTAVFRTSDLHISDSALHKVTAPIHIAHVAFELANKLGKQYSWV